MPEPVRRTLEKQFGCPVRAWYSNEENGIMGLQNEKDEGYRIDTETYYYEILKMDSDEPAEQGELGRIVITDLLIMHFRSSVMTMEILRWQSARKEWSLQALSVRALRTQK